MIATAPQIDISAILAAVDWRAAKAEMQRRDRKGRFAEMGGGFSFDFALPGGGSQRVTGKIVGVSGTETVDVEIKGYAGIQDGVYAVPSTSGDTVKAVININPSGIPDAAPQTAPAPETPELHPQLVPTDSLAEARETGRPLRALQRGTFPAPVQKEYDRVKAENENIAVQKEGPTPLLSMEQREAVSKVAIEEFEKIGFTTEESRIISDAIIEDLESHSTQMIMKNQMSPEAYEKRYGDAVLTARAEQVLQDASIAIAVPYDILDKVIADGRFKSQFETNSSRGALLPETRTKIDVSQFGYHPSVDPTKRPIFGYLTSGGKIDGPSLGAIEHYGEIQFVMKKDLQARTTYTSEDSLAVPQLQPKLFGQVSPESGRYGYGYGEAQMHGGVSFEDVEYAVIQVRTEESYSFGADLDEEKFQIASDALTKAGIRVVRINSRDSVDVASGKVIGNTADPEAYTAPATIPDEPVIAPNIEDLKQAVSKAELDMQLTPTDDLAEAKATGRPLRALQDGSFPKPVQEAFDKVKLQNTAKWDESQPQPTDSKFAWDQFRSAATTEYMKLGFTEEESLKIRDALQAVLVAHLQTQELKAGMEEAKPGFFDEKYSDERKLQTAKDALVDARIAVAVDSGILDKLLESGRFKSQFETKNSKGTLDFKQRSENDTYQLGYHPSVDPEKRPIYGYVTSGGTIDDEKLTSVRQYGEVQLIMRKEVEARSTYTTEDSLNDPSMRPAPFGVPSARTGVQPASEYSYAEAQMHGGVSIEDVEFAVVYVSDRPFKNAVSEEKFAQISETLAKSNIRVIKLKDNQVLDVNTGQATDLDPEVVAKKEESVV